MPNNRNKKVNDDQRPTQVRQRSSRPRGNSQPRGISRPRRRTPAPFMRLLLICALILIAVLLFTCARRSVAGKTVQKAEKKIAGAIKKESKKDISLSLCFAGDINLDDDYFPMQHFQEIGAKSISDVIDPEYVKLMNDADLMWINNEFCYSDGGAPLAGKAFTFCANPENVKYLKELGVDVAGLANNHVFDYGEEAILDTFDTLKDAGIPYVGAGHDIDEAASPVYAKAGPLTIAYVAASRAEKFQIVTQEATKDQPGVLRCYENDRFIASIKEAAEHADYVVALPHWGTEHSTTLEDAQTEGARAYIDAGADAVIGAHPHILQGLEFYEGKPIVYSLGNFWFDNYELQTMVAEIRISRKGISGEKEDSDAGKSGKSGRQDSFSIQLIIHPGIQSGMETRPADDGERDEIFRHLESISPQKIQISDKGLVSP